MLKTSAREKSFFSLRHSLLTDLGQDKHHCTSSSHPKKTKKLWKATMNSTSILMFIVGELAGVGSVAVAVGVSDTWQVTGDTWQVNHNMWHVTHDTWHLTPDTWHLTPDTWHLIFFLLLSIIHTHGIVSRMQDFFYGENLFCFIKIIISALYGDKVGGQIP